MGWDIVFVSREWIRSKALRCVHLGSWRVSKYSSRKEIGAFEDVSLNFKNCKRRESSLCRKESWLVLKDNDAAKWEAWFFKEVFFATRMEMSKNLVVEPLPCEKSISRWCGR